MRPEEWNRINKVAVAEMRVREEMYELMDVFEAEHGYASPELKTAFDLLTFSLEMFEKVLCIGKPPVRKGRRPMNE